MSDLERLQHLRSEIKEVTKEVFRLLGRRYSLVMEVGKIKQNLGLKIREPKIERELRKEVLNICDEVGLGKRFASRVLRLITEESVKVQRRYVSSSRKSLLSHRKMQ